ncbi:uncharacterized protein BYT42DRAFT_612472 [Radiomyces spectabilis]|uniref:uncharacterized protein n=1 Tax=Radiomyces spectabilis TaxID=64574 RepID=UPI002220B365|nr:uncharacterized protein BYT42DRAFT_612472 [Radiomyces spectabilis]KAI8384799.1 hypothetical protein BYT42DRAFT_612472 [Radiomyces spectabilis]
MGDTTGRKPTFSRLMGMKFMQRGMEKEKQEQIEKERKRIISEAEWVLEYESDAPQKASFQVEYQPSYLAFSDTANIGRKSFQQFNKSIEATAEDVEKAQQLEREEEKEKASAVDDKEMLDRMSTIREMSEGKRKNKFAEDGAKKKKKKKKQQEPSDLPAPTASGFIKPE